MGMDTKKITSEILASGITQAELAKKLGTRQSTISSWFLGIRGNKRGVSYETAKKLLAIHKKIANSNT